MNILVTGGLGFLGSNLIKELSDSNHKIIVLDNLYPLYGGNEFNLHDVRMENVRVEYGDCRDYNMVFKLVNEVDVVYHFAAQVSYIDSFNIPFQDLDINIKSTLNILEAIRQSNRKIKIVFSSSRMVYGKIIENPVLESHPTNPLSMYGVNKRASEQYIEMYGRNFGIPYSILRITNPYGIKQQMKHNKYSIVGWFIRLAMEDKPITIFGDGNQMRDYIYISDMVSALLSVGVNENASKTIYNLGTGHSIKFKEMVETIIDIVGKGSINYIDWPEDYEQIETGHFEVSVDRLKKDVGWKPKIKFSDGITYTYQYYLNNYKHYFN